MNTPTMICATDVTEELLLARFWQLDLSADQMRQVDALIAADPHLLARWERLRADMTALKPVAVPAIPFDMLRRLRQQLKLRAEHIQPKPQWPRFVAAFAAGAAAVLFWVHTSTAPTGNAPVAIEVAAQIPPAQNDLSLPAVRVHLTEAQDLLRVYDQADGDQQKLLADVIAQNQSYQFRATQRGQSDLARVLGALQPVLIALQQADQTDARRGLIEQFEFESQALLTKLQARASQSVPKTI
jgi:anti-sigma factor RsiW